MGFLIVLLGDDGWDLFFGTKQFFSRGIIEFRGVLFRSGSLFSVGDILLPLIGGGFACLKDFIHFLLQGLLDHLLNLGYRFVGIENSKLSLLLSSEILLVEGG